MPDLSVEVRDRQIVVSKPSQGLTVTYLKDAYSPLLVALDPMRDDPDSEKAKFLACAWRAAYSKAKELSWI
jgi:hypothetical protein